MDDCIYVCVCVCRTAVVRDVEQCHLQVWIYITLYVRAVSAGVMHIPQQKANMYIVITQRKIIIFFYCQCEDPLETVLFKTKMIHIFEVLKVLDNHHTASGGENLSWVLCVGVPSKISSKVALMRRFTFTEMYEIPPKTKRKPVGNTTRSQVRSSCAKSGWIWDFSYHKRFI